MLSSKQKRYRILWALVLVLVGLSIGAGALLVSGRAVAADSAKRTEVVAEEVAADAMAFQTEITGTFETSDAACRLCHEDTEAVITFDGGESLPVQVDPATIASSAHGILPEDPLNCTSCHAAAEYQFPHPPVEADTLREYEILRAQTCESCHQQPHITSHPGPEADNPVICTDCHSAHDVQTATAWEAGEGVAACADCHAERGVSFTDPETLTAVVQNGLFAERVNNDYCLSCHTLPGLSTTLESGQELELTIDPERFHDSVHGTDNPWQALACTDCHEGYRFPHEPIVAATRREYALEKYTLCAKCHEPKYENTQDSVHAAALEAGNEEAAVCTDCHGAHYTPVPDEPRSRISLTCGQCHGTIFEEYADSVHGEALLGEENPDVAVCTDCHGVHNIGNPELAAFRNSSPELCGECHADEQLMENYGISTDVFDTYVDDFHGTTVALYDDQDPDAESNKAVCYDCHGVHDIKDPDDPEAGIKANLLETCRKCHPDASENFPDSWLHHYQPSLEHYPLVFLVNWFYKLIIPGTVAFLGLLVGSDVYRRIRRR